MTPLLPGLVRRYPGSEIRYPDFEVSWAGDGPAPGFFYVGSEDGRLRLVAAEGLIAQNDFLAAPSREAINGAACSGPFVAVSTRSEVTWWSNPGTGEDRRGEFRAGAHGVIATASGQFVAPLGPTGLLVVTPQLGDKTYTQMIRPQGDNRYFYRVISIATPGHAETLACATRQGGITALAMPGSGSQTFNSGTFPGLDVIDVCGLGSGLSTPAVCALGKDRTLVFIKDVLRDRKPAITMKFDGIHGVAYRLMSTRGHLFLLTSGSLYLLTDLTSRFLEGQAIDRSPTLVRAFPVEAVDANLSQDGSLLIVTTEGVLVLDVNLLANQLSPSVPNGEVQEVRPTAMEPAWATQERELSGIC